LGARTSRSIHSYVYAGLNYDSPTPPCDPGKALLGSVRAMARYTLRAYRIQRAQIFLKMYMLHWILSKYHYSVTSVLTQRASKKKPLTRDLFVQYIIHHLCVLKLNRYTHRSLRYRHPLPPFWVIDDSLLTDREFKAIYRMTRVSFSTLLEQIFMHPVFYSNSNREQRPLKYQLQVALYHFGGGCSGSRLRTAVIFRIGEGTVEGYVRRVIVAILSLQEQYIQWPEPNSNHYQSIVCRHQVEYGFPNCLGFVDGTLISLFWKPVQQGERYHTQKGNYALNATTVVDSTMKILFVTAGRISFFLTI
jgi:hypothetical protein